MATNDIRFKVKNGLAVGASGFGVINTEGEWIGASGPGQSPYGATGPTGIDGASGPTGQTGTDGASGITGETGEQGILGTEGHQGATGLLGSTGAFGDSGIQGASGADGFQGATGSQGTAGATGAITLQHGYEWTDDQLVWNGNAYAGGASPGVSRLEFLQTDGVYTYLNALSPGATLVIDWQASGLVNVATVTTIGTVQAPTAYTNGRHYLQISANPDGYASGGYASTDSTDVLMIGDGPRNQGFRGIQGASGATGINGASGIDGASGVTGEIGATGPHGDRYHATSTSTLNLTTGATGITLIENDLNYSTGQTILLADGGGKHIHATVVSYNQGTKELLFTPIDHVGSGSSSSWEVNLDGVHGPQGDTGATGYTGATGVLGSTGYQGASGSTGLQGSTGAAGIDGASGVDGVQGATGLLGATGAFGEDGEQGITGEDGFQGATGAQGSQGDTGDVGHQGASGATGTTGDQGEQGVEGDIGHTGSTGATGAQGPEGNQGYNADQLTTGNPRGAWDPFTEYFVGDIVVTAAPADSHRCLIQNTGNDPDIPSAYWQDTAWAGASGVTGIDGASGPTGPAGATGIIGINAATGPTGNTGATGIVGTNAATGATGYDGATGYTGATGTNGASGPTGSTGTDGATGYHGLQFKATAQGNFSISAVGTSQLAVPFQADPETGNTFYNYSVGQSVIMAKDINNYMVGDITATDGTYIDFTVTKSVGNATGVSGWIINLNGAVGEVGASGATGVNGATGILGASGATGAPGASGVEGEQGIEGPQGTTGASGATGPTGERGITGDTGATGIEGEQGTQGASGATGVTGATGISGATGFSLATGSTGLTGTSQQTVNIFAANMIGTAKYIVQGVNGSNVQATEVILTQNASGVYITEYATLRTNTKVMDVTATTNGSVVSLKVTPTASPTAVTWVREDVVGRIGGITVDDPAGTNTFQSYTNSDNGAIPVGKAYVYLSDYFKNIIDWATLASTNASVTLDAAGVGPQNPAVGTVDSYDGVTLILTIVSGNFTSRLDLDKVTYGY